MLLNRCHSIYFTSPEVTFWRQKFAKFNFSSIAPPCSLVGWGWDTPFPGFYPRRHQRLDFSAYGDLHHISPLALQSNTTWDHISLQPVQRAIVSLQAWVFYTQIFENSKINTAMLKSL